jgi:carbon-monoxide dehydrogenase large subunit
MSAIVDFPVEVEVPDVGGGFGQKARFYPEYVALAAAAHRLGRPIRWLQTRRENLLTGSHGRDMRYTVRLGGDTTGRVTRAHVDITANVGAFPHIGGLIAGFARLLAQEMYDIPTLTIRSRTLATNTDPIAPYRGAGRPQAAYGMERAIDDFARAVGMEPAEVRRRNLIAKDAFPYSTNTGAVYDSGDYQATLDLTLDLLDLNGLRGEQARRRAAGDNPLGIGFGAFVERAGGAANTAEFGRVELLDDGTFVVQTGSTSNGQGHETVWAQLVAQVFEADLDDITVVAGDTTAVTRGTGSTASRSAQIGGAAVWRCAERLSTTCATIAAELLDTTADQVAPRPGGFADSTGAGVTLEAIHARATERGVALVDEEWYSPGAQTFPYGIHAAVVEVEVETGEVRVLHYVAVDDAGKILNPMIVEGQTLGSVVQGIGQAMSEHVQYDDEGQLLTATLVDYRIPQAAEIPPIVTGRIVSPAPSNPLGVKGAAEGGTIGAPPAIVNAVLDALAPLGVTTVDMPLRPDRVWAAIQAAREPR